MLESGVVLNGRYRLDERVATGGMGDVWRGTDMLLDRRVAVKVLLPALLADPGFLARFRAEARMLAALHHPGIVQVYDSGEDTLPGGARADYLVMEYVDGEPLSDRIRATGRLPVAEAMSVVAQAASALHAAHLSGIVHRDVKPSNLLVQADGTVRLLDFGVARSVNITGVTTANAVPGTALYMAPEQAAGRPVSAATDIYALGAVAYHCVAGDPPFTGDNPLQVAVKHLHEEPAPLPAEVPASVAALIHRALAKDPADRYPSAEAFAEAASAVAADPGAAGGAGAATTVAAGAVRAAGPGGSGRGPSTLPDNPVVGSPEPPAGRPRWRGASVAGLAAVVGLAVAGVVALVAFRPLDNPDPPADQPSPTVVTTPSVVPSGQDDEQDDPDTGEDDQPSRPGGGKPRPTPSDTPTPDPSPDVEPTGEPSGPAEPTGPAPTPSRSEDDGNPPPTDPPGGGDGGEGGDGGDGGQG